MPQDAGRLRECIGALGNLVAYGTMQKPRRQRRGSNLRRRGIRQIAYSRPTALSNVAMGLHHGICHVLGGTTGAPHGDVNSVMLPHVMRFNLAATAPVEPS